MNCCGVNLDRPVIYAARPHDKDGAIGGRITAVLSNDRLGLGSGLDRQRAPAAAQAEHRPLSIGLNRD